MVEKKPLNRTRVAPWPLLVPLARVNVYPPDWRDHLSDATPNDWAGDNDDIVPCTPRGCRVLIME